MRRTDAIAVLLFVALSGCSRTVLVPVPPRIVLSRLGDEAVALGGVRLALQEVEERLFGYAALPPARAREAAAAPALRAGFVEPVPVGRP